jgi:phosphatidylethanolamine-binding protein (PEBP) family uncharacterized protein
VNQLPLIARSALLCLCACSVELGGQGEVTSVIPDGGSESGPAGRGARPVSAEDAGSSLVTRDASSGAAEPDADAESGQTGNPVQPTDPSPPDASTDSEVTIQPPAAFVLTSPAFAAGGVIPALHTCGGKDDSPVFAWSGAPANTAGFVLVLTTHTTVFGSVSDWQRWAIWNIPATLDGLPASLEESQMPAEVPGALQASNESDTLVRTRAGGTSIDDLRAGRRYRGPCAYGFPQTFEFKLYALGAAPAAPAWRWGIDPSEIAQWLESEASVLGVAELAGVSP